MAEKVGGIEYDIDVNTGQVKKATGDVSASARAIEASFDKVDKATKRTDNLMKKSGRTFKNSSGSIHGLGRSAGQASIQIQQFTGQISGGVNPLVAFSQQAADLGIVLGAPLLGSIVGIGAALAVNFVPNVFGAKTALERLEETAEKIKETMELNSTGVAIYSDELKKLAARSESLAKVKVAMGIADASVQLKTATDEIRSSVMDLSQGTFKRFNDLIAESGLTTEEFSKKLMNSGVELNDFGNAASSVSGLARKLKITKDQAFELAQAMSTFYNNQDAVGVAALENSLSELNKQTGFSNEKLLKFTDQLIPFFNEVKSATDISNEFKMALSDLGTALEQEVKSDNIAKVKTLAQSLGEEIAINTVRIEEGEQAARRLAIAFSLGKETVSEIPADILKQIEAMEAVENKQIQMQEAEKARMIEQAELQKKISDEMREYELANKKTLSQADALMDSLRTGGMSELEKIQEDFEAKRELLLENEAILLGDKTLSDEQKILLEQQTSDALTAIEEEATRRRIQLAEMEQRAKMQAVSGAFKNLSALMNTESKKMFEIGKAAALAGAIVDGIAAVQGAFKVGNSIGGPYVGAAFAAAAGIQAAVQVKNIQKQKVGGAGGGANTFSGGLPATRTTSADVGQNNNRNITVSGIDANSLISGGQLIRLLEEYIGDGGTVSFAGGG